MNHELLAIRSFDRKKKVFIAKGFSYGKTNYFFQIHLAPVHRALALICRSTGTCMTLNINSSVGSVEDVKTGGCWFFPSIDDSHCDRIHSSLTAVRCFYNAYVEKQPGAWKEYCSEYLLVVYIWGF